MPKATAEGETEESAGPEALEGVVVTRTPMPTATPGFLAAEAYRIAEETGLAGENCLGLAVEDWFVLILSLLLVIGGYLIDTWLIWRVLRRVVRRTPIELDDPFLAPAGDDVRWLVVLLTLHFATARLIFVSVSLEAFLLDAYFVVGLFLVVHIVFKLIDLADGWALERSSAVVPEDELEPLIVLLTRPGRVLVAELGFSILLSCFDVNVTAFATWALALNGSMPDIARY